MGVDHFFPIVTQNTNYECLETPSIDSYAKVLLQSTEQCERLSLPTLHEQSSISNLLALLENRPPLADDDAQVQKYFSHFSEILVCRERATDVEPLLCALRRIQDHEAAEKIKRNGETPSMDDGTMSTQSAPFPRFGILIGPEGGFTTEGRDGDFTIFS